MDRLYELMPGLARLHPDDEMDAIVRMCIAHVLNGGDFIGVYATAEAYLIGLDRA